MKIEDTMTNAQLIQVAKAFIAEKHPEWKSSLSLPTAVRDKGACWEVSFEIPELTLGGAPVVEIDKKSKTVTRAYHTQ